MTNNIVLQTQNLSKRFKLYSSAWGRLKEWATFGKRSYHNDFWSLTDISFEVYKGEFLGIIGPNGAGKSTLLKVITGILEPTEGTCNTKGKVLSLLELNGGMEDNLSGRENVVRSAQLLEFPDGYLHERMGQIEHFADLGDFFDRPLRVYSSGMRIRLAFSLFAFLECDVLVLDEVLAVGDIFFKQKCYARLEKLIEQKTAIIFVTHSTSLVREYCDNVMVLDHGKIKYYGEPDKAIQKYFQLERGNQNISPKVEDAYAEDDFLLTSSSENVPKHQNNTQSIDWPKEIMFITSPLLKKNKTNYAELKRLIVCDEKGSISQVFKQGEKAYFYFEYQIYENIGVPILTLNITNQRNLLIHSKSSLEYDSITSQGLHKGDIIRFKQMVKLDIMPNKYVFNLFFWLQNQLPIL